MASVTDELRSARGVLLATVAGGALLAALWAYWPLWDNYFLCDDFMYLLVGRRLLENPSLAWHQGELYRLYVGADLRPLGNLLWAGLVAAFGTDPRGYYALLIGVHLLNGVLLGLVLYRWRRDELVAILAAALFLTAYGVRDAVCWISNLNEEWCLTLALIAFGLTRHPTTAPSVASTSTDAAGQRQVWGAALILFAGALIKESILPLFAVLAVADGIEAGARVAWRRWWPVGLALLVYLVWHLLAAQPGGYEVRVGPHVWRAWPALVTASFVSDLWPRVLAKLGILPLVTWPVTLILLWLAVRGPRPARILAVWVLVQPVLFSLATGTVPEALPSRYLYLSTAPAMTLVAMAVAGLYRRLRPGTVRGAVALAISALLLCGSVWGLRRIRADEAAHWQVAADTLRRDFTIFREADLPAGTTIYLHLSPEETPSGGLWWGWEGYPVVSDAPVSIEVHRERVWSLDAARRPYALFVYSKKRGPRLVKVVR